MIYTYEDKTDKKYTVRSAVNAAKTILGDNDIKNVILDSLGNMNLDTPITLERLNNLSDKIIADTYRAHRKTVLVD